MPKKMDRKVRKALRLLAHKASEGMRATHRRASEARTIEEARAVYTARMARKGPDGVYIPGVLCW